MKKLLFFFLFSSSIIGFSQIKGVVTDEKGETLPSVTVLIENSYNNTTTNEKGLYDLNVKNAGKYTVVFQYLGFKTKKVPIDITTFPYKLDIKLSEEKYRNLFDFNPNCIIIWDPVNFQVLEVNNRSVQEYGHTKEEFLKMTILDFRPPSDYTRVRALAKAFFENNGLTYTATREHIHKNGEILPMNYVSRCISYKGKIAILAMGTNIKEKLKLEKALEDERTQKQIEITEAVITAQENERKQIGEELHDNVNQILAGSLLYLGLSRKDIAKEIPFLKETEKLINAAIYELRNLSHSLIPPRLPESELSEALDNVIKVTAATGIAVYKEFVNIEKKLLSPKLQLAIYRIVQEQFGNILKHAKANNIYLSIINQNNVVQLSIKDDGQGFDTNLKSKGVGLMNIKARASLFDSKVTISSAVGRGCELKISFPQSPKM